MKRTLLLFITLFSLAALSQEKNDMVMFKPFIIIVNDCGIVDPFSWRVNIFAVDTKKNKVYELRYDINNLELSIPRKVFNDLPKFFELRVFILKEDNVRVRGNIIRRELAFTTKINKEEMKKSYQNIKISFHSYIYNLGLFRIKRFKKYYVTIDYGNGSSKIHIIFSPNTKIEDSFRY